VSAEAQANTRKERRWQVPLQIRITTRGKTATHRILLTGGTLRLDLPNGFESALVNAGGHGFYRVQYDAALLERLLQLVPDGLSPIERFNLVNDARAATLAGRMPLTDYLDLTARFTSDRDKNVWAILIDSFNEVNLIIRPEERPALERLVRDRLGPAVTELGWTPQSGEDELRRQLRADLLAAMGTIGNDPAVQQRTAELYAEYTNAAASGQPSPLDPNLLPAMITILAYTGEAARYEQFLHRFRKAATPQEERRFLYSLAMFRQPALLERTLARTINGEVRTQDGPFLVRLMLMNVYGRELAWQFVKANWETMDRLFPKNGLRRLCGGIVGLATPDLERDVRKFFLTRNVDLGGKALEQYLEQLHILVTLRQRTGTALPIALRPPA
ncbi:MAG: ERAP1-like C-terminal domain-containing protein, partial [Nitrospirales bacterium]